MEAIVTAHDPSLSYYYFIICMAICKYNSASCASDGHDAPHSNSKRSQYSGSPGGFASTTSRGPHSPPFPFPYFRPFCVLRKPIISPTVTVGTEESVRSRTTV